MYSKERADQISGGVFLIGLGLMFTNILPWWPGIMFVLGASAIAKGLAQGKRSWQALQGGIWLIGIGLLFGIGFSWPLLLILIGAGMLFGWQWNKSSSDRHQHQQQYQQPPQYEKRKNNDIVGDLFDEGEREISADGETYRIGDDGELIKVKNDEKYSASGRQ